MAVLFACVKMNGLGLMEREETRRDPSVTGNLWNAMDNMVTFIDDSLFMFRTVSSSSP